MNLAEKIPDYICICSAATNENMFPKVMELPEYGIAVFDKGYNRYSCFEKWSRSNKYFVTRKKTMRGMRYLLILTAPIDGIESD